MESGFEQWKQENLPGYVALTREEKEKALIITLQEKVNEGELTEERMEELLNGFGIFKIKPEDADPEVYEQIFTGE